MESFVYPQQGIASKGISRWINYSSQIINTFTFVSDWRIKTPCIPIARMLFCRISILPIVYLIMNKMNILQQESIQSHTIPTSLDNQHTRTNTIYVLVHATYDRISSVFQTIADYDCLWE